MLPDAPCRLSSSTFVEPLVNSWSAWPALLSPVPASLHLDRYQLPVLRSFIENPEVHWDASRSPELVGGPFAGLPPDRVPDVEALVANTERTMAAHLRLAREFDAFQRWLVENARGLTLEPHYERVPAGLRGCVELVYDYWHRPSVRVMEPVVCRTPLYQPELQSVRLATLEHDRGRSYFLNTPRLDEPGTLEWRVPFAAAGLDDLFRLDVSPRPAREICDLLGLGDPSAFDGLFCAADRPAPRPWTDSRTRVRYCGHACVLVERAGHSVLFDPFLSATPRRDGGPRYGFDDLPPEIDYAVVTHAHLDHFCLETLLRLRHRLGCLVLPRCAGALYGDVSLRLLAERLGFRRVVELDVFDSLPFGDGSITAIPFLGEHSDIAHSKNAYVVRAGQRQILFAADSDCLDPDLYAHVRRHLGVVDTAFVGMESEGAILSFSYGSLLPDKPTREQEHSRRQHGCNAARALQLCDILGATEVYNYAMGVEPWLYHVLGLNVDGESAQWRESEAMLKTLRERRITSARLNGRAELVLDEAPRRIAVAVGAGVQADARETGPEFRF